jgi:hypothetical protein
MPYQGNPKKADMWGSAMSAGTKVFQQLEERTKKEGFTRPITVKIMKPVWPFFEKLRDPDDIEQIYLDLEEMFDDFWNEVAEHHADMKREYPDEDPEPADNLFWSRFSVVLQDELYNKLLNID